MKVHTVFVLICLSLTAPSAFAQSNGPASAMAASPAVPEEARRHFVMGTTLFKEAKAADDFSQVESEFKKAADLAPQWPDARYNLALAKEAAGNYSGAMADLKLYQQFKISDSEARTVQDKIYALEAKAGASVRKQIDREKAKALEEEKRRDYQRIGWLQEEWSYESESPGLPNSAAKGIVQAKTIDNVVEIGTINNYSRPIGDLLAVVGQSGSVTWEFRFVRAPGGCMDGKRLPVAVTVAQDQRTIRFQADSYGGAACNYRNLPFIVTLTRK
jgi:hypothetical protein